MREVINRTDDFVVRRKGCQIFFYRAANGEIRIISGDPHVNVMSYDPAKARRELHALYSRAAAAKRSAGKLRGTSKK